MPVDLVRRGRSQSVIEERSNRSKYIFRNLYGVPRSYFRTILSLGHLVLLREHFPGSGQPHAQTYLEVTINGETNISK